MLPIVPTICAACAELLVNPAIVEPHAHMTRLDERAQATEITGTTRYRCLECESLWELQFMHGALAEARLIDDMNASAQLVIVVRRQDHNSTLIAARCRAWHPPYRKTRSM